MSGLPTGQTGRMIDDKKRREAVRVGCCECDWRGYRAWRPTKEGVSIMRSPCPRCRGEVWLSYNVSLAPRRGKPGALKLEVAETVALMSTSTETESSGWPETEEELHLELERIDKAESQIDGARSRVGNEETEWQLAHCRVMRRLWENDLARLVVRQHSTEEPR